MRHSENMIIFRAATQAITYADIVDSLNNVGASECDVLFIHSDIGFGVPEKGIKREELKSILADAILELDVKTLIFPTFTFSYCNNEDYDIQDSKTAMGMLPEYIRKRTDSYRTDDPILSVAIIGNKEGFDKMDGDSPCGKGGIFHQLHSSGKVVKFLFFGTPVSKCFTYLHYVEEMSEVDYRYSRRFSGNVVNNGVATQRSIELFVRYKDVKAILPEGFEDDLLKHGISQRVELGLAPITCVEEKKAYQFISELIKNNPHSFCELPGYAPLVKEYNCGNIISM